MGDEIRFVKNWKDALDKIALIEAAGLDSDPYVRFMLDKIKNNPEGPYWELEKFLFDNSDFFIEVLNRLDELRRAKEANPYYPPPSGAELEAISGSIPLGIVNHDQAFCGLNPIDFTQGFHICGIPGCGKTFFTLRLIDYLLSIPRPKRDFNILMIQALKRDADFFIKRHNTLWLVEYPDNSYNMFQFEGWDNPEVKMKSAISIFSSVNYLKTLMQPILKQAVRLCYEKGIPPTFTDINLQLSRAVAILEQQGYDSKNSVDKIRGRISEFEDTKEIFNCRYGYPIESFWSKEDIIVNVMDEPNPYIYSTFVTDLLITLQRYQTKQPNTMSGLKTLIVIDECRSIFPNINDKNDFEADRFLEQFITTSRSSGIGRITITQEPESVSGYLMKNAAFFLTFQLRGPSVTEVQRYQNLSDEQAAFLFSLPKVGTGIFRDARCPRPYIIDVPDDFEQGEISISEARSIMRPYIKALQESIRPKEPLPVQIEKRKPYTQDDIDRIRRELHKETFAILQYLKKHPFKNETEIGKATKAGQKKARASLEELNSLGLILEIEAYTSAMPRKTLLYPLTEKGFDVLGAQESDRRPMPERYTHTYYPRRVT